MSQADCCLVKCRANRTTTWTAGHTTRGPAPLVSSATSLVRSSFEAPPPCAATPGALAPWQSRGRRRTRSAAGCSLSGASMMASPKPQNDVGNGLAYVLVFLPLVSHTVGKNPLSKRRATPKGGFRPRGVV